MKFWTRLIPYTPTSSLCIFVVFFCSYFFFLLVSPQTTLQTIIYREFYEFSYISFWHSLGIINNCKNNIKTEKPIKLPPKKQWKKNYVHKLLTRNTNLLLKNSVNSINLNLMKINRNKHHSIMTEK